MSNMDLVTHAKLHLLSFLPLLPHLVTFLIYSGLFYSVLGRLRVEEKRLSRAAILAVVLMAGNIGGNIIASAIAISSIEILIYVIFSVFIFYIFVQHKLALNNWQIITLPLGVTVIGQFVSIVLTALALRATV